MTFYARPGCTGSAAQTGVTDADGLTSFTDLGAGAYSIQETLRPGHVNVSSLCQDVTLAQSSHGGRPDSISDTYPPGGDDTYAGGAYLELQLGTQPTDTITLNGPLVIHRNDAGDANRNGLADVQMQADDPWKELKVTWNTQPGTTSIGKVNGVGTAVGTYDWDVTGLAQSWVDGTANNGLALWSYAETTFGWRGFASRESASPPRPPRLTIAYRP